MTRKSRHAASVSVSTRHGKRRAARRPLHTCVTGGRLAARRETGRRFAPLRRSPRPPRRRKDTRRWFSLPSPLPRRPIDPELLFVECGRCGAPVLWDPGRATRLLAQAGVDPLELDSSCLLMTDGCPFCRPSGQYTVQIYRVSNVREGLLPPLVGHA